MSPPSFAVRHPVTTLGALDVVAVLGLLAIAHPSIEFLPPVAVPRVVVSARLRAHPRIASVDMDRSFMLHEEMYEIMGTPYRDRLARAGLSVAGLAPLVIADPASSAGFSLAIGLAAGRGSGTTLTLLAIPVAVSIVTRARQQP